MSAQILKKKGRDCNKYLPLKSCKHNLTLISACLHINHYLQLQINELPLLERCYFDFWMVFGVFLQFLTFFGNGNYYSAYKKSVVHILQNIKYVLKD